MNIVNNPSVQSSIHSSTIQESRGGTRQTSGTGEVAQAAPDDPNLGPILFVIDQKSIIRGPPKDSRQLS